MFRISCINTEGWATVAAQWLLTHVIDLPWKLYADVCGCLGTSRVFGVASGRLSRLIVCGTFKTFETTLSQQEREVGGHAHLSFFSLDISVMRWHTWRTRHKDAQTPLCQQKKSIILPPAEKWFIDSWVNRFFHHRCSWFNYCFKKQKQVVIITRMLCLQDPLH